MRDMLGNNVNIGDSVAFIYHGWSDELRVEKVDSVTPGGVTVTVTLTWYRYNSQTCAHDIQTEPLVHTVNLRPDQFVRALRDAS